MQLDPVVARASAGAHLREQLLRALRGEGRVESAHLDEARLEMSEAQLQIEHYWAGALRRAVVDGDVENGSVMAGQSVGMVSREEPAADIVAELVGEAAHALDRRGA